MATILLMDDSRTAQIIIQGMLIDAGHEVILATNGAQGLEKLKAQPVDLVITDMYMPDKDGIEVITELRARRPNLPVIAMSASLGRADVLRMARMVGALHTLQKPFTNHDLLGAVAAALNPLVPLKRAPATATPADQTPGETSRAARAA